MLPKLTPPFQTQLHRYPFRHQQSQWSGLLAFSELFQPPGPVTLSNCFLTYISLFHVSTLAHYSVLSPLRDCGTGPGTASVSPLCPHSKDWLMKILTSRGTQGDTGREDVILPSVPQLPNGDEALMLFGPWAC